MVIGLFDLLMKFFKEHAGCCQPCPSFLIPLLLSLKMKTFCYKDKMVLRKYFFFGNCSITWAYLPGSSLVCGMLNIGGCKIYRDMQSCWRITLTKRHYLEVKVYRAISKCTLPWITKSKTRWLPWMFSFHPTLFHSKRAVSIVSRDKIDNLVLPVRLSR